MLTAGRFFCISLLSITCCACFERIITTELAPVSSGQAKERPSYAVRKGDTLFSIAWKFDKDYKALAYYNQMEVNSSLRVGQKIKLVSRQKVLVSEKSPKVITRSSFTSIKQPILKVTANKMKRAAREDSSVIENNQWYWPAKGKVTEQFLLAKHQKGIEIEGVLGSDVFASKAGTVAYSGNGLRGYGNLVILRHKQGFLSAYAFNRKIFVKEGENVKAKQKIAEIGSSKGGNGRLHFEIRKKGQPIDPLKFLIRH